MRRVHQKDAGPQGLSRLGAPVDVSSGALRAGDPLGVYVHFPFCSVRCPYCDFAVDTRAEIPHDAYADAVIAEHPKELKLTPGKMVQEIQPKIDWDKGKAVLYLLEVLDLSGDDVAPLYIGDDITDEDAFQALSGRGIGIFVGRADDPEVGSRTTSADYVLHTMPEVERFLRALADSLGEPSVANGAAPEAGENRHA